MFNLISLIKAAGYFGMFGILFAETGLLVGVIFPGDSLLFTAGFLASQGFLKIGVLCLVTFLGAVIGEERRLPDVPRYDHDDLARIFLWAKEEIEKLLGQRGPERRLIIDQEKMFRAVSHLRGRQYIDTGKDRSGHAQRPSLTTNPQSLIPNHYPVVPY